MKTKIEKEVRYLKIYAMASTLLFAVVFLTAFAGENRKKFEEIDVERINIVEKNGKLKMVISNQERQHPGVIDGVELSDRKGQRPPGMIFFSEKGDEIGGLIFHGDTGKGQGGSLTFDKFRGDQTIQFTQQEEADGTYFSGLRINDQNLPLNDLRERMKEIEKLSTEEARTAAINEMRGKELLPANRLKLGKDFDKSAFLEMKDARGKTRIKISVEANGNPKINFLDETGKVVYSLPDDAKAAKK